MSEIRFVLRSKAKLYNQKCDIWIVYVLTVVAHTIKSLREFLNDKSSSTDEITKNIVHKMFANPFGF